MSLRVWIPMVRDFNGQGVTKAPITTYGLTLNNNGKLGKCGSFNGSSNVIATLPTAETSSIGTMACWVKFNSLPASGRWYCLAQLGTAGGFANCKLGIYMQYQTDIVVCINGSSDNNLYKHSLTTNQWYHLCTTFDGTTIKLYIDGVEVWTKTAVVGSYTAAAPNLYIGGTNNYYLNGYMNDARYYDHALSPKEVKELAKGLVCHYPLSDTAIEATTNLVTSITAGGQTTVSGDIVTTSGNNADTYFTLNLSESISVGTQYTISCDVSGIPSDQHWLFPLGGQGNASLIWELKNGHNEYTFTANNIDWGTKRLFMDDTNRTFYGATTFSHFQLEKKDHATLYAGLGGTRSGDTTVYDCSGYQYNGAIIGSFTVSNDSARYSYSTLFTNGTANYTNTSLVIGENKGFTMSLWMKSTDGSAGYGNYHILASIESSQYEMSMGNGGRPRIGFNISGTRYVADYGDVNCLDKKWHMITMTYDGDNIKAYVDGENVGTTAKSGTLATGTKSFRLGNYMGVTYGDKNILKSDVRIYATALSEDDIKELYNTVASVANNGTLLTRGEFVEV